MDQFIIDARFNGPPGSGNGGYTAGLVASRLAVPAGHTAQVTLRVPPPLDTPLRVLPTGDGIEVSAGEQLVAEATPVRPAGEPVPAVTYQQAAAASADYPGFTDHPFPSCYVCGPDRPAGDGLRIFPGLLPGTDQGGRTAAGWLVPDGTTEATVWAALDCPGGWAIIGPGRPYVLGRMAAVVRAVPPGGAACVVVGAVAGTEGRKAQVRTALYAPGGGLFAHAQATWIAI